MTLNTFVSLAGRLAAALGTFALACAIACTNVRSPSVAAGVASDGATAAPVTLLYYTNYRCIACRTFAARTLPALRRRYVETGSLRIVARDLASDAGARSIANAARCAGEFGKYWAFHDSVSTSIDTMTTVRLQQTAKSIGVPTDPFARCIVSGRYDAVIRSYAAAAKAERIEGSLVVFVGRSTEYLSRIEVGPDGPTLDQLERLITGAFEN